MAMYESEGGAVNEPPRVGGPLRGAYKLLMKVRVSREDRWLLTLVQQSKSWRVGSISLPEEE